MYFHEFLTDSYKSIVKILLKHTGKHFKTLTLGISIVDRVENAKIHFFFQKIMDFLCFPQYFDDISLKLYHFKWVLEDTKIVKFFEKLQKPLIQSP